MHVARRVAFRAVSRPLKCSANRSFAKPSTQPTRALETQPLSNASRLQFHLVPNRTYVTEQAQPEQDYPEKQSENEQGESSLESAAESAKETVSDVAEKAGELSGDAAAAIAPNPPASTAQTSPIRPESSSAPADLEESPRVYLGNLYFEVNPERLRKELENFGEVLDVKVVYDARGLSKGFAFADFASNEQANKAVDALNGYVLEGRKMAVAKALKKDLRSPSSGIRNPPSRTLFIGNMAFEMSDKDLNELFREVKNVLDVRVAIDRRTGQPRGFAHADFLDVASAEKAAEFLRTQSYHGRALRVDFSSSTLRSR